MPSHSNHFHAPRRPASKSRAVGDREKKTAAWTGVSRRDLLRTTGAFGLMTGTQALLPGYARGATDEPAPRGLGGQMVDGVAIFDMEIAKTPVEIAGRRSIATTINGTVPGPLLRLREGQETLLRVSNRLKEDTSIHWHGILVPPEMDGVPGVSFHGIRPGQTFEYRFPLQQYGTYWYHSHSGLQEQLGHYGPLIVEPAEGGHPYAFQREHFIVLSDWTFEDPYRVLAKLKKQPDYYNFQKRTVFDFLRDARDKGLSATVRERLMWSAMRMNPTDIADITGATYTYLINGLGTESNWTGLYRRGERVLLHFINASAGTFFDVRIPGLPMTVVQSNGQHVMPVDTDEFRIAIAETYSVIVEPREERPYTVFAESMDRSGYARGTLAPRAGLSAAIPPPRKRPVLTMADMGMAHDSGQNAHAGHDMSADRPQDHAGHDMGASAPQSHVDDHAAGEAAAAVKEARSDGAGRKAVAGAILTRGLRAPGTLPDSMAHEPSTHGSGNAAVPTIVKSRLHEPGLGLGGDGWRVLTYADLRALERRADFRPPDREIEMHLTGNMERFMWSIDGVPFAKAKPIALEFGERLRLTMVNDTMMNHPMHLHGMWMELENGHGEQIPRVHTVNVKPAERLSLLITVDAPGKWAFHCHVLYHMEVGMFRVVEVSQPGHRHRIAEQAHED